MSHRFVARSSLGASRQGAPGFAALAGRGCAARRVLSRGRSCGSRDIPGSSPTVPMAVKSGSPVGPVSASVRDAVPRRPPRGLSRGECGAVRAGRGSSVDFPSLALPAQ